MKKILTAFCCAAFAAMLATGTVCAADREIVSLTPMRNVGIFESTDEVRFSLAVSNAKAETVTAKLYNVNGEEKYSRNFQLSADSETVELNFGEFPTGWYRIRLYDASGNSIYDKYAAFSVTEPYSTRRVCKNSPFAIDSRVAEYKGDAEKYAEAYRLAGITQVRERGYYKYNYSGDNNITQTINAYSENGIDVLNVWSNPGNRDWRGDLRNVYNWQKESAAALDGKVNAWEIINEPDIINDLPADLYSAFLKAGALGVKDGNADAKKSFGAMCSPSAMYAEYMMQNGVMDYLDTYNTHTHRDGALRTVYQAPASAVNTDGRMFSTIYGGGSEIWLTESGLRMVQNSDGVPGDATLKNQAAYIITSCMDLIASSGTDKHFFFLGTPYIETNRDYGMFSSNDMPYPSMSAVSALTYYLGEGKFLGELYGLKGSQCGFLFDTGDGLAAVLYNKEETAANIQIDTDEPALLVDLIGGGTQRIPNRGHGLINVPVTDGPVIVVLGDRKARYCEKKFEHSTALRDITNNQRVVIQPIWQDGMTVTDGRYILERGQTYTVKLRVYNFAEKIQTVVLNYKATGQITALSKTKEASTRIKSGEYAEFEVTLTVDANATPMSDGFFSVTASKYSPAVSAFRISDDNMESIVDSKKQISSFYSGWTKNDSANSRTITRSGKTLVVTATWNKASAAWIYPYKTVSEDASGYDGLYFTAKMTQTGSVEGGKFGFNVYVNDILESAGTVGTSETTIYIPWERFDGLDTTEIQKIAVGFTASGASGTISYTISDLGFYKTKPIAASYDKPTISINAKDNQIWCVGEQPSEITATLDGSLTDVKVYVNYKNYTNFTADDNAVSIDISELDDGAHNIIVTGRDEFNVAVKDDVSFYLRKIDEWYPRGIFF